MENKIEDLKKPPAELGSVNQNQGLHTPTIIAICAFLGVLFGIMYFVINASTGPINKSITKLETGQAQLKADLESVKTQLKDGQAQLDAKIEAGLNELKQLIKTSHTAKFK